MYIRHDRNACRSPNGWSTEESPTDAHDPLGREKQTLEQVLSNCKVALETRLVHMAPHQDAHCADGRGEYSQVADDNKYVPKAEP